MKKIVSFLDDEDKMKDFNRLTEEEFLKSYNYLSEEEYYLTKILNNIIERGLDISVDEERNFADVCIGFEFTDFCDDIEDIDYDEFEELITKELEKDKRILKIAGGFSDECSLDIIFTDEILQEWEKMYYGE